MKELVEYIAKSIVNYPDQVKVSEETNGNKVLIKVEVNPEDKGRMIGKEGKVAEAIRSLLRVVATKNQIIVKFEIV
jgi:uncharacterized protein